MNSTNHSTVTPSAARHPLSPKGLIDLTVDMDVLGKMPLDELRSLREAMHTISEVLTGFYCQPRFSQEDDSSKPNAGGHILADLVEFLDSYKTAIINLARATQAKSVREVENKAWLILGQEVEFGDQLVDITALAAEFARDLSNAEAAEVWAQFAAKRGVAV